jgi:nucleotide-binding universal stress UspA family protein
MKLLVALDLTDSNQFILDQVKKLTAGTTPQLWFLHVAEPEPDFLSYDTGPQTVRDSLAQRFHQEHRQIQQIAQEFRENGLNATALLIQCGTAATILAEAEKLAVDLIIIGSHRRGLLQRLILGSTSAEVVNQAKVPVLVVPPLDVSPQ